MMLNPYRFGSGGGGGGDPDFSSVVLLAHFDGTNGSTTFTDSSSKNKTITRQTLADATISTAQSKFGGASLNPGTNNGAPASIRVAKGTDFNLGTGDFTVELFAYITSQPGWQQTLFMLNDNGGAGGLHILVDADGAGQRRIGLYLTQDSGGGDVVVYSQNLGQFTLNTWQHYAVCRNGNTFRLFLDGVQLWTTTSSKSIFHDAAAPVAIGTSGSAPTAGFIDEVRVTQGVGRYTANFTPPAAAFPNS